MEPFTSAQRKRIIELFQSGLEGDDVAEILCCSASGARRVWQRFRADGQVGPRPHAGGHAPKVADERKEQVLGELVAAKPDAFCRELADELFARTGVRVCRQTIGTWLDRLGLTRKKRRCTRPSNGGRTSPRSARSGPPSCLPPAAGTTPA
jgi:transposase